MVGPALETSVGAKERVKTKVSWCVDGVPYLGGPRPLILAFTAKGILP